MNAKELLNEIERLETEIQKLCMKRDSLRAIAESTVTVLRIDNVTGSHNNRKLEDLLNESAELDKKIDVLLDEYMSRKLELVNWVEGLENPTVARLVVLRGIEKRPWPEVAEALNYALRSCYRLWNDIMEKQISV